MGRPSARTKSLAAPAVALALRGGTLAEHTGGARNERLLIAPPAAHG